MKCLILLTFLALCILPNGAVANDPPKCEEEWHGDGGCDAKCAYPWKKCCVKYDPVCKPHCSVKYEHLCVHDPDYCWTEHVEKCENVPKKVCEIKPVCERVKEHVCKVVKERRCYDVDDKKCEDVHKCDWVPDCYWKDVCTGGSATSIAKASASGGGRASSTASGFAATGRNSASGLATATGGSTRASVVASANKGGCRKEKVCDRKKKCTTEHVCKPYKRTVCKDEPVKKCRDEWHDVCNKKKVCEWVDERVCKFVDVEVCKDPVTCYHKQCGKWQKCNPHCCPVTKTPVCVDLD